MRALRTQETKLNPLLCEVAKDTPPKCCRQFAAEGQAGVTSVEKTWKLLWKRVAWAGREMRRGDSRSMSSWLR